MEKKIKNYAWETFCEQKVSHAPLSKKLQRYILKPAFTKYKETIRQALIIKGTPHYRSPLFKELLIY
jgi:hypothetical protein